MLAEISQNAITAIVTCGTAVVVPVGLWMASKITATGWNRAKRIADRIGLTMEPVRKTLGLFYRLPRASGIVRNKRVQLYNYTTGSGKSQKTWSAISAQPRVERGLTLSLSYQGFGSKVRALFGAVDIEVGDPVFDRAWFIETNQPGFIQAGLIPELREKFSHASRGGRDPSLKLDKGAVVYVEKGSFFSEARGARFEQMAEVVCDFADLAEVYAEQRP